MYVHVSVSTYIHISDTHVLYNVMQSTLSLKFQPNILSSIFQCTACIAVEISRILVYPSIDIHTAFGPFMQALHVACDITMTYEP